VSTVKWPPYSSVTLGLQDLPSDWIYQIEQTIEKAARITELRGDGPTGHEASDAQAMIVKVVDGYAVRENLPWLWDLYASSLRQFCETVCGKALYLANDIVSSVNINLLEGEGARYERHVDSNPLTGLLFATTLEGSKGGQLVFQHPETGELAQVEPRLGQFLCFDARRIVHWVAPLGGLHTRISIPMNYYESAAQQDRPDGLNEKLYG
jgi:hypothetical protein